MQVRSLSFRQLYRFVAQPGQRAGFGNQRSWVQIPPNRQLLTYPVRVGGARKNQRNEPPTTIWAGMCQGGEDALQATCGEFDSHPVHNQDLKMIWTIVRNGRAA